MHVALVIGGGLALLGLFILFGWLWGANSAGMVLAAKGFLPVWLLVACINMWVGIFHAGYSVQEELPILLMVFVVPAVAAGIAIWLLARG